MWVNAAGNFARRHWAGSWQDGNGNGLLDFTTGVEMNVLRVAAGRPVPFLVVLHWDDSWGAACQDYDLAVSWQDVQAGARTLVSAAPQACQPGQLPLEVVGGVDTTTDEQLAIVIRQKAGAAPRRLELYTTGGELTLVTPAGSVAPPADLPQVLAVGAVSGYNVRQLQPYSSQGPSPAGVIKPDFVASDNVSTASYEGRAFAGTSAAAPT